MTPDEKIKKLVECLKMLKQPISELPRSWDLGNRQGVADACLALIDRTLTDEDSPPMMNDEVLREQYAVLEDENTLLKAALYCYARLKWPIPIIGYFPDMAEVREVQNKVHASSGTARSYLIMTGGNVEEAVTRIILDDMEKPGTLIYPEE